MKSIVVGTAGHIDHGKTALVKSLTGIDADRLQEEKRRGITIDLGFAHMDLPGANGEQLRLGFVDVPGHERFVRNMLAGVGGIDLVLLVIAADEAIKPQTREHFDILQLLGVQRGITVLTKSDTVDADTLEVVKIEVEDYLRGTFLDPSRSPIVAVSALTGAGLPELKQAIAAVSAEVEPRDFQAMARLPIDRVFTMKGFGTVVTGTLIAGTIQREDDLEVYPTKRRVRVRGVQVHGQMAQSAVAGQRTALNLAGASTEDLSRGMIVAAPGIFTATRKLDVHLRLLPSAPRPLRTRARIHFHSNAMEAVAEVVLHGTRQIVPGEEALARLKLPEAALLLPGDRFIVRQFSPIVTIGGGIVLDASPIPHMPEQTEFVKILMAGNQEAILKARIARRLHHGISLSHLVAETGWTKRLIETQLTSAVRGGFVSRIGDLLVDAAHLRALKNSTFEGVAKFHQENPLLPGINREELRDRQDASVEVFQAILESLIREKKLELIGDLARIAGRGVVLKDEEVESKSVIEDAFSSSGLKVPSLQEVIAGLKVDKARAQKIVTLLLRDKVLVKVSDGLVFHRNALQNLRQQMAAYKIKSTQIDVAQFKELTGVTRKYAIPLLEYLDREHVTRRVGDIREIVG